MKTLFGAQKVQEVVQNGYEELDAISLDTRVLKAYDALFYIQQGIDFRIQHVLFGGKRTEAIKTREIHNSMTQALSIFVTPKEVILNNGNNSLLFHVIKIWFYKGNMLKDITHVFLFPLNASGCY